MKSDDKRLCSRTESATNLGNHFVKKANNTLHIRFVTIKDRKIQ